MNYLADLHIHSHYSMATSKDLVPEHVDLWGRIKGITVVGTGDFTHPGWTQELREKIEPAEPGLFRLKPEWRLDAGPRHDRTSDGHIRFLLTSEISTIYKKGDKTRKVHHVILAPDFETVEKIQYKLGQLGNITSDGRPILGLDSRHLLEIVLEANEDNVFIPAHIWTPWFSALGDKSGFDSIDECYGDLAQHIDAVETGLSSDPPMNWRCSFLDRFTIVSNSDAHSPQKLGREANLLNTELSYEALTSAIRTGDPDRFLGTVEFFPEEGKYHHDGHRKCKISWNPQESARHDNLCPVCGKRVTVGVLNRIQQLSDRDEAEDRPDRHPFHSVIPLKEVLSEILNVGPNTKKVSARYQSLIAALGSEFDVLLHSDLDRIEATAGDTLAEAVKRMRRGEVHVTPGYDGEFGVIKVFTEQERRAFSKQGTLFADAVSTPPAQAPKSSSPIAELPSKSAPEKKPLPAVALRPVDWDPNNPLAGLNASQRLAAEHRDGPAIIIAGPGTGKTRVLTCRIAQLIKHHDTPPEAILGVTYTAKAAREMQDRLDSLLPSDQSRALTICTFHALGYQILREQLGDRLLLIDEEDKARVFKSLGCGRQRIKRFMKAVTAAKQQLILPQQLDDEEVGPVYRDYQNALAEQDLIDLDDLIFRSVRLLLENKAIADHYRARFHWIMVDEYQDINFAQYQMIRLLAPEPTSHLCVIGDPNQAIYGFRGADVRFIRQFREDWPDARAFTLTTSYRCSETILQASRQVVGSAAAGDASLLKGLASGVRLQLVEQPSDRAEAEFVARTIEQMIGGLRFFSMDSGITEGHGNDRTRSLADFAVLCRTSGQMAAFEEAFHNHSVPYQKQGAQPLFREEPVKTILSCLRLALAPENRFLKQGLLEAGAVTASDLDQWQILPEMPAKDALAQIIEPRFAVERRNHEFLFRELMELAEQAGRSAAEFLRFTQLATSVDTYDGQLERVALMTLHASKGLEFPCVFIAGCEEGLLPYHLYEERAADVDEERRLLYVGMTRAQHFLYLSWAKSRLLNGRKYHLEKSSFLDTIEKDLTEQGKGGARKRAKKPDYQLRLFE